MYIAVGLGNPGDKYLNTRHNTGRMFIEYLGKKEISGVKLVYLDTFMNKSGLGVAKVIKPARPNGRSGGSKKSAEKLIVVYDDLDLALGTMKISYNRSSGGHRGVESIIRALKTEAFIRIRIGISPATPSGKLKKPHGEREVEKHILGEFKKPEMEILKKVFKKASDAVALIAEEGLTLAMTEFNK